MTYLIDALVRSVLVGSLYSLMALGLTMTYTSGRFPNFAHGDLVTVGAYASVLMTIHSGLVISTAVAALTSACVAIAMFKLVVGPLMNRVRRTLFLMVATFAVGLMTRHTVALLAAYYGVVGMRSFVDVEPVFQIGDVAISNLFLWTVPTTMLVVLSLHLFFSRTKMGKMMRAAADNPSLAAVCGIDTDTTAAVTWGTSGLLAGIAGSLWGVYSFVYPEVGWFLILTFFAASVIGGMVSFVGTIIGGYVIAFSENMLLDTLNIYFGIEVAFKPLIAFLIIVIVLLARPKMFAPRVS